MNKVFAEAIQNNDFMKEFKESRRESTSTDKGLTHRGYTKPKRTYTKYDAVVSFENKYADFDNRVSDFNSVDLVLYFQKKAEESGYKFFISSMPREAHHMKRLMTMYSTLEICGMIEFLYCSEQDYLDKDRLSSGLLGSKWVNTIYADMKLWVDGEYDPHKSRKRSSSTKFRGEWNESESKEKETYVGEWDV